ncbi:MAG: glycoside hydrolase family 2 TIM barrel-domain containing protein [Ignavibacteria bacterium]
MIKSILFPYNVIRYFIIFSLFLISFQKKLPAQIAGLEATLKMQRVDEIYIPFQNGIPMPSFEKQNRQIIDLKGDWKKQRFNADDNITLSKRDDAGYQNLLTEAQDRYLSSYDDSGWETKMIPSVENQMNPYPTVPEYYENGVWYRRTFNVSDSLNGKFVKLMFYAVNYAADVWLNDVYLGYHEGGYTPFAFDVSSALNYGGSNTLVVRVDNPAWGSRNDIVPYTRVDWFNYTGIIHDVYLEVSNPVSVMRTDIVPQSIDGTIQTTITLFNSSSSNKNVDVSFEIFEADVNESNIKSDKAADLIGSAAVFSGASETSLNVGQDSARVWRTAVQVENPKLWYPKNPNLYIMKVLLKENAQIIDEYCTQFGIRTITTDVDKVLLNNQPVFFTGVARHEDHPVYGRSIPIDTIYEDMVKVKGVNANMLRTAHYPNHLYTYLLADRLGITIIEEIPVWWFDESFPWVIQNSIRHIHEQMFREMVFKDYNRPSIILWSTCNECLDVENRKTYIQTVKQDIKFKFPDGRLITQSAAADRPGPEDPSQAACDVAGWTMYFGIFHGGTYYEGTRRFLGYASIEYPLKPILDTEFGYWSGEQLSLNGQNAQVTVFDSTFQAFTFRASVIKPDGSYNYGGYLMGVTWWCIFDWYSHGHPSGFQSMGIYNMDRTKGKLVKDALKAAYEPYYNLGGIAVITGVNDGEKTIPDEFILKQNYPNPFNPTTNFGFRIPASPAGRSDFGFVSLKVYDVLGREVAILVNEEKQPGEYNIIFNSDEFGLSSGVYIYRLTANNRSSEKKMILLK